MTQLTRRLMLGALPGLGLAGVGLAGLGLAGAAYGQQINAQPTQAPPGTTGVPPGDEIDYLPDSWVDSYGRPTAKVMINGQGPFQFMVDTGSTTTVIAQRHVATVGAPLVGLATVAGTTGVAEMPLARLDKVTCGVVSREELRVAVLPDENLSLVDGILGADVFAGRRLVFNIAERSVRVEPTRRRQGINASSNMRVRNGLLAEIDGKVGDVNVKLMLDTGAQNCIANMKLSEALQTRHSRLLRVDNVRVYGVTGHRILGQYIALPRVDLKAFQVEDSGCVAADAPIFDIWGLKNEPAMIVGVNVLARLDSFSIDYGARLFDAKLMAEADLIARNAAAFG